MDAISLAIVVTVLSLGSVLVYLFKSDFEGRQKILAQSGASKKNVHKLQSSSSKQQVPSEVSKQSSLSDQQSSNQNTKRDANNKATVVLDGAFSTAVIKATNVKQQTVAQQSTKQQSVASNKSRGTWDDDVTPSRQQTVEPLIADSLEPSQDELDSSILLGVFNPTNSRSGKTNGKKSEPLRFAENKKTPRRKQHQENEAAELVTSEQLFGLIAASSLSKDEIELAVETLLNKLESGESNWQQPKCDPLCRLKARLRDHENKLTMEIALHETTREQLVKVMCLYDQVRSDSRKEQLVLQQLRDENSQLIRRLGWATNSCELYQEQVIEMAKESSEQLEQARCDLSKQQMIQKQIQEERSQTIEKLEQDKAQLQAMLLELQSINSRQEEMLKRLRDERHLNEASMKRTLLEMEQELKELQSKLSSNSASHDERLRKEMSQVERELNIADQREQKLLSEMRELREGLSALFPDIKTANAASRVGADDWVHQYLEAVKQLSKTVDELREANNNNDIVDSPSKKSAVDKSTSTLHNKRPSSRVSSPISNGRSSKAGIYYDNDGKRDMETKLLELMNYASKLEEEMAKTKQENLELSTQENQPHESQLSSHEQLIKELKLQKSKLETQVKIGLDSLKMEQERTRSLEKELSKYSPTTNPQAAS